MTMFQIPKSASHPLDKYRQASIDYISGSQIWLSGDIIVGGAITTGGGVYAVYENIVATTLTGSSAISGSTVTATTLNARDIGATNITGSSRISGSTMVTNSIMAQFVSGSNTISGAAFKGPLVNGIQFSGSAAQTGTFNITTGAGLSMTLVGTTVTISLA